MSALRKKLQARKGEEVPRPELAAPAVGGKEAASASSARTRPVLVPGPSSTAGNGMRRGFMSAADLYPTGSSEGGRAVSGLSWKEKAAAGQPVFQLRTLPDGYEVYASFREAGRFLGKDDFTITRECCQSGTRARSFAPASDRTGECPSAC
jgi:hypothetical protein